MTRPRSALLLPAARAKRSFAVDPSPLSAVAVKRRPFGTNRIWTASTRSARPVVPAVPPSRVHRGQPMPPTWARRPCAPTAAVSLRSGDRA